MRLDARASLGFRSTADEANSDGRQWCAHARQTGTCTADGAEEGCAALILIRLGRHVKCGNGREEEGALWPPRAAVFAPGNAAFVSAAEYLASRTGRHCSTARHRCGGALLSSACTAAAPNHREPAAAPHKNKGPRSVFLLLLILHVALCIRAGEPIH